MNKNIAFGITITLLLCGVTVGIFFYKNTNSLSVASEKESFSNNEEMVCQNGLHTNRFFDEDLFFRTKNEKTGKKYANENVGGVIIPHHLLASRIIAGTLESISSDSIETVFVIGPDHYRKGKTFFTTSLYNWETSLGTFGCEGQKIHSLLQNSFVKNNPQVLEGEHSISGILPHVKFFFPNARVVPILVRMDTENEMVETMSQILSNFSDKKGKNLFIASLDFSHYLSNKEAKIRNKETLKAMQSYDYTSIRSFDDKNVDSPETLEIFLRTMEKTGFNKLHVLYDTDSGVLTGKPFEQTTSYFGIVATLPYEEK